MHDNRAPQPPRAGSNQRAGKQAELPVRRKWTWSLRYSSSFTSTPLRLTGGGVMT